MNDLLKKLQEPFDRDVIKEEKIIGRVMKYIPVIHYVNRLNEIVGNDWKFEIEDRFVHEGKGIVIYGALSIKFGDAWITHKHFGGKTITTNMSAGDNWKSAHSDCFKKCCSMFGIGKELYIEGGVDDIMNDKEKKQTKPPAKAKSDPKDEMKDAINAEGERLNIHPDRLLEIYKNQTDLDGIARPDKWTGPNFLAYLKKQPTPAKEESQ